MSSPLSSNPYILDPHPPYPIPVFLSTPTPNPPHNSLPDSAPDHTSLIPHTTRLQTAPSQFSPHIHPAPRSSSTQPKPLPHHTPLTNNDCLEISGRSPRLGRPLLRRTPHRLRPTSTRRPVFCHHRHPHPPPSSIAPGTGTPRSPLPRTRFRIRTVLIASAHHRALRRLRRQLQVVLRRRRQRAQVQVRRRLQQRYAPCPQAS